MVSGGGTHRNSRRSPTLSCSKLVRMLSYETTTPFGVRVDPEVYCKYAMSDGLSASAAGPFPGVQVQQINLDDRRRGFTGLRR